MSMSDPIADLLTRIRNGLRARHRTVDIPASRLKREICRVLREEGYILDFTEEAEPAPGLLRVELKYIDGREPVVQGLRRISRPSLRRYAAAGEYRQVRSGLGVAILTTSRGVMTNKQARREKVGGEVLCEVW
jgi:small subunit ribosomal protein S8